MLGLKRTYRSTRLRGKASGTSPHPYPKALGGFRETATERINLDRVGFVTLTAFCSWIRLILSHQPRSNFVLDLTFVEQDKEIRRFNRVRDHKEGPLRYHFLQQEEFCPAKRYSAECSYKFRRPTRTRLTISKTL